jgi:hypothetical protein
MAIAFGTWIAVLAFVGLVVVPVLFSQCTAPVPET